MAEVLKDRSMLLQKEMLASHFARLEQAPETGEPVVYTFVPGNLTELIGALGMLYYFVKVSTALLLLPLPGQRRGGMRA